MVILRPIRLISIEISVLRKAYSGTLNLPDGVSFIQSRIEHVPMTMGDFAFDKIPEKSFTRQSFARNNLSPTKVKTMHFGRI